MKVDGKCTGPKYGGAREMQRTRKLVRKFWKNEESDTWEVTIWEDE